MAPNSSSGSGTAGPFALPGFSACKNNHFLRSCYRLRTFLPLRRPFSFFRLRPVAGFRPARTRSAPVLRLPPPGIPAPVFRPGPRRMPHPHSAASAFFRPDSLFPRRLYATARPLSGGNGPPQKRPHPSGRTHSPPAGTGRGHVAIRRPPAPRTMPEMHGANPKGPRTPPREPRSLFFQRKKVFSAR